ncbi:unnamed protein product [Vicia faba]|uniref:Uncharacterized protein n=1 Tax=Vicia faba TaxID=3906 RepID=A0AAV1APV5_VICFA|nr:unnamed protein product [Vicia faba]
MGEWENADGRRKQAVQMLLASVRVLSSTSSHGKGINASLDSTTSKEDNPPVASLSNMSTIYEEEKEEQEELKPAQAQPWIDIIKAKENVNKEKGGNLEKKADDNDGNLGTKAEEDWRIVAPNRTIGRSGPATIARFALFSYRDTT